MRRAVALGMSAALMFGAGACSGGDGGNPEKQAEMGPTTTIDMAESLMPGPPDVPMGIRVTNSNPEGPEIPVEVVIDGDEVVLKNPNQVGPDAKHQLPYAGVVKMGYHAVATCYFQSDGYGDQVYVEGDGPDGLMFVEARHGSMDQTPEDVFDVPGPTLQAKLPACQVEDVTR